jgi:hypothetical protein
MEAVIAVARTSVSGMRFNALKLKKKLRNIREKISRIDRQIFIVPVSSLVFFRLG